MASGAPAALLVVVWRRADRRCARTRGRRSTVRAGGRRKLDRRPLTDKAYQAQGIRALIAYLTSHGYDNAISPKILTTPTAKDFVNIVRFLLRQVDPRFKFSGPMESEIPVIFKGLKYPFGISKTALTAVGSSHAWPPLFGSLTWLIDLLKYDEVATQAEDAEAFGSDAGVKLFFEYTGTAYQSFLAGDDERSEELHAALAKDFADKNARIREDTASFMEQAQTIEAEITELTEKGSSLPGLTAKRADYLSDHEKFSKLIVQLEQHKANLQRKQGERADELSAAEAALAEKQAEIARLQQRIDTQEVSAADAERMGRERESLRSSLDATLAEKDAAQAAVDELDVQLAKRAESLSAKQKEYAASVAKLQVSKYAPGVDFDVEVRPAGSTGTNVLTNDIEGAVCPALESLKAEFTKKQHTARRKLVEASDGVADMEESIAERERAIATKEDTRSRLDSKLRSEKEGLEAATSSSHNAIEALYAEIESMQATERTEAEAGRDCSEAKLAAMTAEAEAEQSALDAQRRELYTRIVGAMDRLTNHKKSIQERLEQATRKLEERIAAVRASPIPSAELDA